MGRKIVITCLAVLCLISAYSQRLLPKQKGISLSLGIPIQEPMQMDKENCVWALGFTRNAKNGNYWLFEVNYWKKGYKYREQIVPLEDVFLESGYMLNVWADGQKRLLVNLGIVAVIGYERLNGSESFLDDGARLLDEDNVLYGVGGQMAVEGFLSDRLVLFAKTKTARLWNTDVGQFRPSVAVGVRVLL